MENEELSTIYSIAKMLYSSKKDLKNLKSLREKGYKLKLAIAQETSEGIKPMMDSEGKPHLLIRSISEEAITAYMDHIQKRINTLSEKVKNIDITIPRPADVPQETSDHLTEMEAINV